MQRKSYFTKVIFAGLATFLFTANAFAFHPFRAKSLETTARAPVFQLNNATNAPTSAPFDGGISLLIAAGIGYASKKGYDKRKQLKKVENV